MKKEKQNIIEIQEEVSIIQEDGTKIILEKGDKVEILNEKTSVMLTEEMVLLLLRALSFYSTDPKARHEYSRDFIESVEDILQKAL